MVVAAVVSTRTAIVDDDNVIAIAIVVVVVIHGHALDQARWFAMRRRQRRRVVALPSSSKPYLRVSLPPAVATRTTRTAAASAVTTVAVVSVVSRVRISRRRATAVAVAVVVAAAAALVPSALEPVGGVVALLFLEFERALLHSQPVLVARALADVDGGARAPAVAERLVVCFPVARPAGARRPYGGV
jgi:hypothetical protein